MSFETTYTNKNNISNLDKTFYPNEKEVSSNTSTSCKKQNAYSKNKLRNQYDLVKFKNNRFLPTPILTADKKPLNSIPESTIQKIIPDISLPDARPNTSKQYNLPINHLSFLNKINTTNIKSPSSPTNLNHNHPHEKN